MLIKLLKYELKASARTLAPLYIGILVVSLICGFLVTDSASNFGLYYDNGFLSGMIILLLVALFVALGVLTIVSIIQRFNQSLLGDEGFLMFTLPISHRLLLASKLMAALIWIICGGIVTILSGVIVFGVTLVRLPYSVGLWSTLQEIMGELFAYSGVFLQASLLGFLGLTSLILAAYLAMMIGQLQYFSNHRVVMSFVSFFIINWLLGWLDKPFLYHSEIDIQFNSLQQLLPAFHSVMLLQNLLSLAVCVGLFFLTEYLMRKKLNL